MEKRFLNPTTSIIFLYILAIVVANNMVNMFGEIGLWITGFLIIPFDLLARDILHEKWKSNHLFKRMFLLVISGGLVSFATNPDTLRISLAGVCAFACSGFVNTIAYYLLYKHSKFFKMNASNLLASIADTSVFLLIAFGLRDNFLSLLVIQILIKFFGGMLWSTTYIYYGKRIHKS